MDFRGAHIISVSQFERDDIEKVFAVADSMEPYANRKCIPKALDGAILGNMFFEPRAGCDLSVCVNSQGRTGVAAVRRVSGGRAEAELPGPSSGGPRVV